MICEQCGKTLHNTFIQDRKSICFECLVPNGGNADSLYNNIYVKYGTNNNTDGTIEQVKGIVVILEEQS